MTVSVCCPARLFVHRLRLCAALALPEAASRLLRRHSSEDAGAEFTTSDELCTSAQPRARVAFRLCTAQLCTRFGSSRGGRSRRFFASPPSVQPSAVSELLPRKHCASRSRVRRAPGQASARRKGALDAKSQVQSATSSSGARASRQDTVFSSDGRVSGNRPGASFRRSEIVSILTEAQFSAASLELAASVPSVAPPASARAAVCFASAPPRCWPRVRSLTNRSQHNQSRSRQKNQPGGASLLAHYARILHPAFPA